MADNVIVDNGDNTDYTVSSDEAASGQVQRVKLTYSADGSDTHVDADIDGLLVNLGTNNDVVISDGGNTITVDGTVAVSGVSGTVTVDASGAAVPVTDNAGSLTVDDGGSTISVDDGGGVLTVDGTVGVSGTVAVTDNAGSLTVDAPVGTPAFVRLSDGSSAISTLPVSLASVPSHAVTNAGTFAVQVDGSALTALQKIDDPVLVDDAAFTPASSSVSMAGYQADESSTDSVDEGDAGAARMTLDRKVIVQPQPHTAGGLSIFRSLDLDETEEDVKTSAGQVYGWYIANTATSTRFVKFYNATAANVTVGSTTPVMTLPIPGNSSDDVGANALGGMGIAFDTAICVAATTGVADNDTGAPSANDVIVNIFYK